MVIPALDLLGGRVVRLRQGRYDQVTTFPIDPLEKVREYATCGSSWVHVVDLEGAREGRASQAALVEKMLAVGGGARVQVGGGIRTLEQVRDYVSAGASRVVLGTRAVQDPAFVTAAAALCEVMVAVDGRDGRVAVEGWTRDSGRTVTDVARVCVEAGARSVLFTEIARDGMGSGPAVEATETLGRALPGVGVFASGGVGSLEDLRALVRAPSVAGVIVGRALLEGRFTMAEALSVGAPR
ncbi:MAG: 1-(5-phosphoribosyl)-5-((5-phosphoribosylamino)methylideneamino)imidazole-4-carboxamide isomerase [Deltaproteobacteria bacterium]|nr:1-(5-phosphoribosyl)-5-((5-phosphoribosylamino)methylideneamino)imidazole-4-carboxamide isomerase [Deltaproteobacteria bacterium]